MILINWFLFLHFFFLFSYRFVTKVPGVLYIKQVNENDAGEYRYTIDY